MRLTWELVMHSQHEEHLLKVFELNASYGESKALHGINLSVNKGEVVTLLGRNGAGKTTTLKSIMGLMSTISGSIKFEGNELLGLRPEQIARRGVAYCPEERAIYSTLSVEENLMLPPSVRPGGMPVDELYQIFPNLSERKYSQGTKMSGGEQQMLAIARILRTGANFILLDEPTEGLAPVIVQQIGKLILQLKEKGFTILLVEQNFHFAVGLADRHYILETGRVVDEIRASEVAGSMEKLNQYLGV